MKKLMALGLALTMVIAVMAGCGQKDKEVLTMGTNAGFPPFEYKEGTEIVGIDVEIANLTDWNRLTFPIPIIRHLSW